MKTVYLVASGDLRLEANQDCWAAQAAMEEQLGEAVRGLGGRLLRAHLYDDVKRHGFIDSQKRGMEVFRSIPPRAPLIAAEAVWQYSHHLYPGLMAHRGPILTVANWSGTWPGLVGLLNLNACLAKAGVRYSSLWSEDFKDAFFLRGLKQWMRRGHLRHDTSHVRPFRSVKIPAAPAALGREVAREIRNGRCIMGIFDEGCMGMYNAIIPDELLHAAGIFKERLSQSSLFATMLRVPDDEARRVYQWLANKGMRFVFGKDDTRDLTEKQVLAQCKMYIAAVRIADQFGCDAIGIQYQQGLKDLTPASDLAEGLLNNSERPPVHHESTGAELYAGAPLPHFNEVDECAGLDAIVTNRVWRRLTFPPETTLHDLRYGALLQTHRGEEFVWVLEISGAVPPAHLEGDFRGAVSERQPPMYFRLGGGTIKGICKPGWIVWSRIFVESGRLKCDLGIGEAVRLAPEEQKRLWTMTTSQWPMMHLVLRGITRDQMMARHKANHIQVVYAPHKASARRAVFAKAAALRELGLEVYFCGSLA